MTARQFALAAEEYERNLTMEQLLESTPQATSRKIALGSLSQVAAPVKGMHVRNELLVQD